MIVDKLQNATLYSGLSERIVKALNFLHETDLSSLPVGKHEIEGDDLFAVVSEYEPSEPEYCKLEAHRKYIDVQYVISGGEQMGYLPLENQVPTVEYNELKDVEFYREETSYVNIDEGMFAIFFPNDIHMPGVKSDGNAKVKKVVVKVKV